MTLSTPIRLLTTLLLFLTLATDAEYGEKTQVTSSAWRDRDGLLSPDGRYVAYLSDESREQEVWIFDRTTRERRKISNHASFKELGAWSPYSKQIAWAANRLFVADAASGAVAELAYNDAGGYDLSGFSPDSKWLIYSRRDDDQNWDVYLFDIAANAEHNITDNPFTGRNGVVTPDGTRAIFVSSRDDGISHLFSVPLRRQREDPDDPLVKERLRKERPQRREQNQNNTVTPPAPAPVTLETEGIDRRAVQPTRDEQGVQTFFLSLVVTYDPTRPNNFGINLENYGVAPDVWVENTPEDELPGFDRELPAAVDEAVRMLKEGKWQYTTEMQDK